MELERQVNNKLSSLNPSSMKDINMNVVNMFDTNLKYRKSKTDGFKLATKLKRNFKYHLTPPNL